MAIKYVVLFVETVINNCSNKFTWCFHRQNYILYRLFITHPLMSSRDRQLRRTITYFGGMSGYPNHLNLLTVPILIALYTILKWPGASVLSFVELLGFVVLFGFAVLFVSVGFFWVCCAVGFY
jgi:hypothetical protein